MPDLTGSRREFLHRAGLATVALAVPAIGFAQQPQRQSAPPSEKPGGQEVPVSPTEDLMREHGLLNRILLIYDEAQRRLEQKNDFDPAAVSTAAGIVRRFIEEYHEKLEEDFLFPRFEKAGKLTDLVKTLRAQHAAGRKVTARILQLANASMLKSEPDRARLREALHSFNRMYRPHEAREDTVLFPALHELVTPEIFGALGDSFEDKEHELFGEDGFEKMVDRVGELERALGINDLAQFTPS